MQQSRVRGTAPSCSKNRLPALMDESPLDGGDEELPLPTVEPDVQELKGLRARYLVAVVVLFFLTEAVVVLHLTGYMEQRLLVPFTAALSVASLWFYVCFIRALSYAEYPLSIRIVTAVLLLVPFLNIFVLIVIDWELRHRIREESGESPQPEARSALFWGIFSILLYHVPLLGAVPGLIGLSKDEHSDTPIRSSITPLIGILLNLLMLSSYLLW